MFRPHEDALPRLAIRHWPRSPKHLSGLPARVFSMLGVPQRCFMGAVSDIRSSWAECHNLTAGHPTHVQHETPSTSGGGASSHLVWTWRGLRPRGYPRTAELRRRPGRGPGNMNCASYKASSKRANRLWRWLCDMVTLNPEKTIWSPWHRKAHFSGITCAARDF